MSDEKRQSSKVVAVAGAGAIGISALFGRGIARMGTLLDDAVRLGSRPAIGTVDDFASASRFSSGAVDDFAMSSRFGVSRNAGTSLVDDAGNSVTNLDDVFAPEAFADDMIGLSGNSSRRLTGVGNRMRVPSGVSRLGNSAKRFGDGLSRGQDAYDVFEFATDGEWDSRSFEMPAHGSSGLPVMTEESKVRPVPQSSAGSTVYSGRQITVKFPVAELRRLKRLSTGSSSQIDVKNGRIVLELTHEEFNSLVSTGDLDRDEVRKLILDKFDEDMKSDAGNSKQ